MAYNPEDTAKLKHLGSLASAIKTTIDTLDGKKFGDAAIADGKLKFFANIGDATAIKELDLPEEIFLDQTQTNFVQSFVFSAATYPGATNPNLDGKPVLVLAVKGDKTTNPTLTYSFVNLEKLIDTYTAGNAAISVSNDNKIGVSLSADAGNILSIATDAEVAERINQYFPTTAGGNG